MRHGEGFAQVLSEDEIVEVDRIPSIGIENDAILCYLVE